MDEELDYVGIIDPDNYKELTDSISEVFMMQLPEAIAKNIIEVKVTKLYLGYTAVIDGTLPVQAGKKRK